VVDATSVYWLNHTGTVMKVGSDLTSTVVNGPNGLAADATSVYWTNYYGGTVMKASAQCDMACVPAARHSPPAPGERSLEPRERGVQAGSRRVRGGGVPREVGLHPCSEGSAPALGEAPRGRQVCARAARKAAVRPSSRSLRDEGAPGEAGLCTPRSSTGVELEPGAPRFPARPG
jgi:hypothetical protein